jgi:O-antigen/teichoic acid export membrane protein
MSLRKNAIANYIGTGATALAPILALPWYLMALGPQQFGLLGFVATLQMVLNIVDAGMGQALVRELSMSPANPGHPQARTAALVYGFERVYWLISLAMGGAILLLQSVITTHWLHLDAETIPMGKIAVCGAVLLFIVQFPGSLYRSVLIGSERQVVLNKIMLLSALARHGGGVLAVMQWPTLQCYLIWHIGIGLLETIVRARCAWTTIGCRRSDAYWQPAVIKECWPAIASLAAASGLGALTTQLDKVLLSRAIPIADFGYYVIAASLAGGVLQLVYPFMQAALPQAIRLRDNAKALKKLYVKMFYVILLAATLGLSAYGLCGQLLLNLWLKNSGVAGHVYPLLGMLLLGAILNAFYNIGYAHWMAKGHATRILQVNCIAFVLCLLIIPPSVEQFGTIGATTGWLIINLLGLAMSLPGVLATLHEK